MEFYLPLANAASPLEMVSIPNGMEFYAVEFLDRLQAFGVSIPNGMEFYSIKKGDYRKNLAFQFPTGWNSTVSHTIP